MNPVELHIMSLDEPFQSIMLYVRSVILKTLPEVEEKYSYKIPFYYYQGKPMCYLNVLKGTSYVDVGFVKGFQLSNNEGVLVAGRNRNTVKSIQIRSLEFLKEEVLKEILLEASLLNE